MKRRFPPGPPNDLMALRHAREMRGDLIGFCARLQSEYGDVVHFRLGPLDCFQFTHPDQIRDVLVHKAGSFRKQARLKQVFGRFEGNGLVVSDGPLWARQRRLVQPAFSPSKLPGYAALITPCIDQMLAAWRQRNVVDINAEARRLMLRIAARSLFSTSVDAVIAPLEAAVEVIQQWSMREMYRIVATPSWLPLWGQPKARKAIRFLRAQVQRIVRERMATGDQYDDVLSRLINAVDVKAGEDSMSLRQLQDELVTLLLAGHETSAAALTWSAWLLAKHPEIQEDVAAAVRSVLEDRPLSFRDLPNLTAVEQVFKEAMRLYPPVYFLSREAVTTVEIAGYQLGPNSQVFLIPYLTQRDARWFHDPERFDPLRFTSDNEACLPPCCYFPFGAGPRACIGRSFALMEGTLALAAILRNIQLQPADRQQVPALEWQLSLHPREPLYLEVKERMANP